MKLQIFTIKKFLRWSPIIHAQHLDSALKKHEKYYPQVFLRECKYIDKKVVGHIIDELERYSDDFDDE